MSQNSMLVFRGQLLEANKPMALKAFYLADNAHAGQTRKSGEPYIEHPMSVAELLWHQGIKEDEIIAAAILHDTIEDTSLTLSEIYNEINSATLFQAVDLLSKKSNYDNETYYKGILNNRIAAIVKIADRAHNIMTMGPFSIEKKKKYIEETEQFSLPLLKECEYKYTEFSEALHMFEFMYKETLKSTKALLAVIDDLKNGKE